MVTTTMTSCWGLHNTLKGWTLYELSSDEVQLLVHVMSANEIKLSKVCAKSDAGWVALSQIEHPQFFNRIISSSESYPVFATEQGTKSNSGRDTEYFVIKSRPVVPRQHKRYDIAISCTVLSTKQDFVSETANISEGGLQFKDLLPEWIAGYFIVEVMAPGGKIQLMCSLVEEQKEKKRVQIVSEDSDPQFSIYKVWLASLAC